KEGKTRRAALTFPVFRRDDSYPLLQTRLPSRWGLFRTLDNLLSNLRRGLLHVVIEIMAGDHKACCYPGRSEHNRRARPGRFSTIRVRFQFIKASWRAPLEVVQGDDDLQIGFAQAETDDGPAQLIALIHVGEHTAHQPTGGGNWGPRRKT